MKTNAAPAKKMPVRMCVGCRPKGADPVVRSPEERSASTLPAKNRDGALTCA